MTRHMAYVWVTIGIWLLYAFWPRQRHVRLPWVPYSIYRRVWPVYAAIRLMDWLGGVTYRQHERVVRRRSRRVPQIVKDAERCARGDHPAHRVTAIIDNGRVVVEGDEWKGHAAKPPHLLVDIRCEVCGAYTGNFFAIRSIPLDDRLGTTRLCTLANPGKKPLTIVFEGERHDMLPESTPDDECGPPVHLWAKRRK